MTSPESRRFSGFGSNREYFPVTTEESWVWDVEQDKPKIGMRVNPTTETPEQQPRPDAENSDEENLNFHFLPHYPSYGQRYPGGGGGHSTGIVGASHNQLTPGYGGYKRHKYFHAHFEDPKSKKNCPPSFSVEFDLPNSIEGEPPKIVDDVLLPPSPRYTPTTTTAPTMIPEVATEPTIVPDPIPPTTLPDEEMTELERQRMEKMKLVNSDLCGISINTRIIGGEDAGINQFPWMARLAYRNRSELIVGNHGLFKKLRSFIYYSK